MCQQPCLTCLQSAQLFFSQCLSCKSQFMLKDSLCIKEPIQIIQIICTFMLVIFVIPVLMRKRCVTLIRIFDAIQIVAYFKYINGFLANRQNYLYLSMRSWGAWSQGWQMISLDNDVKLPVWTIQQTVVNKTIRICLVWLGIISIMLIIGLLSTMNDPALTFCNFLFKNFPIAVTLGFYVNIQDMGLVMANAYYSSLLQSPFTNKQLMIQLAIGIIFACVFFILFVWMFYKINFDYNKELQKTQKKIYPYVYMFLLSLDYDIFQTYQLTNLPQREKKINRYSNLRLIQISKKVTFSFLIVNSLYRSKESLDGEVFSILGFILFFDILWYISLPYDIKTQKIQLILGILADILVIVILMIPIFFQSELIEMALCLALILLALVSIVLQYFLDVYKLLPVDLYETGLNVVIEDKRLLKQLDERKKLQQQHEKMMKEMLQKNKNLQAELQAKKNLQLQNKNTVPLKPKDDTQQSLPINMQDKDQFSEDLINPNNDFIYQGENYQQMTEMNSDDLAQMYKIDEQKRRKIYQFNKKTAFTYSNKVQY